MTDAKLCEFCGVSYGASERFYYNGYLHQQAWKSSRFCGTSCSARSRAGSLKKVMPSKNCAQCRSTFTKSNKASHNQWEQRKYCSWQCMWDSKYTGYGTERHREMNRKKYKDWRKAVFERDNYTCQICSTRGGDLEADHIKPWAAFKELRYTLSNGRALCKGCHRKTPTYGRKREQWHEDFQS